MDRVSKITERLVDGFKTLSLVPLGSLFFVAKPIKLGLIHDHGFDPERDKHLSDRRKLAIG